MQAAGKSLKRKFKRKLRAQRKGASELGQQADHQIEHLLIRRFDRLAAVKRFVALWVVLFGLIFFCTYLQLRALSPYYQVMRPAPGGLYNEGVVGKFTNASPLYATGTADASISHLIFSGLFKYDDQGQLQGDLAKNYTLDASQKRYTVNLRHDVVWQDGKPFNADDVVYTYQTIQNIESQSPLYSSWQNVKVTKAGNYTVNFDLPDALSSFPYALTNGIVPAHLLSNIPADQLRSASFNTDPIGTGPYEWKFVNVTGTTSDSREQRIGLTAFNHYWAGVPKLDGFSLITYSDDAHLINAFEHKQLNAMSGLDSLPPELATDTSVQTYATPLNNAVMAFFNNSRPLLADAAVRKALTSSVDRSQLVSLLGSPTQLVDSPLLKGQLGYDPGVVELPYSSAAADQFLSGDGWAKGADGIWQKDGQPLRLSLDSQDTQSYTKVAQFLQAQWAKAGIKVDVNYYDSDDLQTSVIGSHSYDILLYGIGIGVDPDVFAYWDSSQASLTSQGHLNLSEYKSTAADEAIEAGRTRSDPAIRAVKYKAFLTAWTADDPALALYQPNFLYITRGPVFNYQRKSDNSSTDRFYNVANWEVRQQHKDIN